MNTSLKFPTSFLPLLFIPFLSSSFLSSCPRWFVGMKRVYFGRDFGDFISGMYQELQCKKEILIPFLSPRLGSKGSEAADSAQY
jgi:hypothetical protein